MRAALVVGLLFLAGCSTGPRPDIGPVTTPGTNPPYADCSGEHASDPCVIPPEPTYSVTVP